MSHTGRCNSQTRKIQTFFLGEGGNIGKCDVGCVVNIPYAVCCGMNHRTMSRPDTEIVTKGKYGSMGIRKHRTSAAEVAPNESLHYQSHQCCCDSQIRTQTPTPTPTRKRCVFTTCLLAVYIYSETGFITSECYRYSIQSNFDDAKKETPLSKWPKPCFT